MKPDEDFIVPAPWVVLDFPLNPPHDFRPLGRWWRWWLCRDCYAPKSLHPRGHWVRARAAGDHQYLSASAPHFSERW